MGRQAYLTKIALGRSAFEPSQTITRTAEYIQLSAHQELPAEVRDASRSNRHIQLYDERGNPTNPRAHEHGRRLREAQNDVLASIGVVERRSPSQDLPGSYAERLEEEQEEDGAGDTLGNTSRAACEVCTWWVGSLRYRVLVFRFGALPLAQIAVDEWRLSGKRLLHAGLEATLVADCFKANVIDASTLFRPLDRLLASVGAGPKTRRFFRLLKPLTGLCLRLSLELLFYPLAYQSCLQRLGLVPAKPFLPPLKAFIPFSDSSPLVPYSNHHDATASISSFVLATLTSPFTFICVQTVYRQCIHRRILKASRQAIVHPDNPDFLSHNHGNETSAKNRSSSLLQLAMKRLTAMLGWGQTAPVDEQPGQTQQQQQQHETSGDEQTIEINGSEVINLSRLEIPLLHAPSVVAPEGSLSVGSLSDVLPPPTPSLAPASPTASQTSQSDDNDPRIRITSREGIVEMEVRLPSHVLTQHTEMVTSGPSSPSHHDVGSPNPSRTTAPPVRHRVTQLSLESSYLLASICSRQIENLALLPLQWVGLRLVGLHYLARHDGSMGRVLKPFPSLGDFTWSSLGAQASRIALCSALEFAVDLGVWGCSYMAITRTGTSMFGWGRL
ncbi:hypothetical protein P280DRAFT_417228 [Massarina eburnea CBS 473.64]|uniref:Mitochondrial carrier n=1 Tax=Massarina eburnea CBS 473.64 TaxID=1395130 RepID=A0A6A6SEC4_9PLEO|nr:hypothetical protein P280DRAFT_417228 [Massarina eburnea CBS 473.64]